MKSISEWLEALGHDDWDTRMAAAKALIEAHAVEPLIRMLEDRERSYWHRKTAAYALGRIGDRRAVEPFTRIVRGFAYSHEIREEMRSELGLTEDEHRGLFMEVKAALEEMGYQIQVG